MNFRALCISTFTVALLLAGCSKNIDTQEAVRDGILKDLAKKMDIQNMTVNVESVAFRGKEADATVSFSPKGAPAGQSITMKYSMVREADEWKIKTRALDGNPAHAEAPGEMPAGHPGMSGGAPGGAPGGPGGALPPGHPTMGGAGGATTIGPGGVPMPPGHPQVDPSQKK